MPAEKEEIPDDKQDLMEKMTGNQKTNKEEMIEGLAEKAEGGIDREGQLKSLDGSSSITDPKQNRPTEEDEDTASDEPSDASVSEEDSSSEGEESELPDDPDEIIKLVKEGKVSESSLKQMVEDHRNKEEWQKQLTQKSQQVSQQKEKLQQYLELDEFMRNNPDKGRFIQQQIQRAVEGDVEPEPSVNIRDQIDLPDHIKDNEETKEFFENLMGTMESQLDKLEQRNSRLEQRLQQNQQSPSEADPTQVSEDVLEEATEASQELDQLKDKYSDQLTGPDGEDKVDEIVQFATEAAQQGRNLSLEQAYAALYPSEVKQSAEKSARESVLEKVGQNDVVLDEDTGEEDTGQADQSDGSLEAMIEQSRNGSASSGRQELKDAVKSLW